MIVSYAKETTWVYQSLLSISTIFMALFFLSIGMLINPSFILEYWLQLSLLVPLVFITTTFINAGILKTLGG